MILDSGSFPAAFEQALDMADYAGFAARQQAAREESRLIGMGICVYHQLTGTGPFEGGSVRVDPTGEVTINSGAAPQGQGTATMLAQIAADELQVPHDTIKVVFGDTGRLAHGMGTYASRNAVMAGTAVVMASTKVREKALALAAHLVEADPSDMVLEDGYAHVKGVPTTRVSWAEIAAAASPGGNRPEGMEPDLESVQYFENMAAPYSYGIHIAEVEVDPDTGVTTVARYVVVNDAGTDRQPPQRRGTDRRRGGPGTRRRADGGARVRPGRPAAVDVLPRLPDPGQPRRPRRGDRAPGDEVPAEPAGRQGHGRGRRDRRALRGGQCRRRRHRAPRLHRHPYAAQARDCLGTDAIGQLRRRRVPARRRDRRRGRRRRSGRFASRHRAVRGDRGHDGRRSAGADRRGGGLHRRPPRRRSPGRGARRPPGRRRRRLFRAGRAARIRQHPHPPVPDPAQGAGRRPGPVRLVPDHDRSVGCGTDAG